MRKIMLLSCAILALASTNLSAQQAQQPVLPITLSVEDLSTIAKILGQLPYTEVAPIFAILQQREQTAISAVAPKPAEAPAK